MHAKKGVLEIVLKKLLVWATVLLIAALLALPAFAQDMYSAAGGMKAVPGSDTGAFTAADCPTLKQDPKVWEMNVSMFPGLATLCGS